MSIIKTFALLTLLGCASVQQSAADSSSKCTTNATVCPEDKYLDIYPGGNPEYEGPTAVELRTAGNFAILTQAGVSSTGGTSVNGDVGVSPAAQSYLTGFGLTNVNDGSATSALVPGGKIYAANQFVPIPAKMTIAIGNMGTAYAAAAAAGPAGTHTVLNYKLGLIDNQVLGPGYYKWGSDVVFNETVTFSGDADDIWILQIAGSIRVGAGASVKLENGAKAQNIFWQTAKDLSVGTTAHVEGVFLSKTEMVFGAGSSLTGAALSQTAVTMIGTTINKESKSTKSRRRRNLRA